MELRDLIPTLHRAKLAEWLGDLQTARGVYSEVRSSDRAEIPVFGAVAESRLAVLEGITTDAHWETTAHGDYSIINAGEHEGLVRLELRAGHPEGNYPNLSAPITGGPEWIELKRGQSGSPDECDLVWYNAQAKDPQIHLFVAIDGSGILTGTATTARDTIDRALPLLKRFLQGLVAGLWGHSSQTSNKPAQAARFGNELALWSDILEMALPEALERDNRPEQISVTPTEALNLLANTERIDPQELLNLRKCVTLREAAASPSANLTENDLTFFANTMTQFIRAHVPSTETKKA